MARRRIGIALGGGAARGWAHIGVLKALAEMGIRPDIMAGTSIGALVGAASLVDKLDPLEKWVCGLARLDILRLMDARLSGGGFMRGDRLMQALSMYVEDRAIEDLPIPFAVVATDLDTGHEVWLREGSLQDAVRASIALPGLFSPVRLNDRWLLDGGLVNPVPVSVCRALGADIVIAVNLSRDTLVRTAASSPTGDDAGLAEEDEEEDDSFFQRLVGRMHAGIRFRLDRLMSASPEEAQLTGPGLFDVLTGSINIVQDRITRSRMAGDPPDIQISPRLANIRLMEFDRAGEAIEQGRQAVERAHDDIELIVNPGD
jgi:NTE family protein